MPDIQLYVGTYAKYNSGSIAGAWLDLESFTDKEDFYKACAELHKDEADPEYMFQDYEGFPEAYYDESSTPDALWAWLALSTEDRDLLAAYQEVTGPDCTIEQATEACRSTVCDSQEDYARESIEDSGVLSRLPEDLQGYFDYEAYARDMFLNGLSFVEYNNKGYVFDSY